CNINLLYEDVFQNNIHLNTLVLIGNPILYIAASAFNGPLALKHLFLQQIPLTNVTFIPLEHLQHLETLSFGNNFISSLQLPHNFPIKNLRVLDFHNNLSLILKGNDIEYIEPNSFDSVNLYSLDLKGNRGDLANLLVGLNGLTTQILGIGGFYDKDPTSDIQPSTLQGLCNITIMEVEHRVLLSDDHSKTRFNRNACGVSSCICSPISLAELILNQNKLANLSDINPSNFPELVSLHINSNMKTIILEDGHLKTLRKLQYLDLSHNGVHSPPPPPPPAAQLNSQLLKYLNLSRMNINASNENLLKGLESQTFLNMERPPSIWELYNIFLQALHLEVLILLSCNLTAIEHRAFHKLAKLQYEDLRHNKITIFSSNAFRDLSHIHLNFASNMISDIASHLLHNISGTSAINLSHNPIDYKSITLCGSPKSIEGTTLSALQLSCGLSAPWIFVIILGTVIIGLGVIFGVRWCRRQAYYGI
ncbi:hypothetical protein XENTR_v10002872, partial [Xenopus tropicalis]